MSWLAIGDLHGRRLWQEIVAKEQADKIIFIGDFFDSHEKLAPQRQIENFRALVDFKLAQPEQVILLIGNHDYHYFEFCKGRYSGFQEAAADIIADQLSKARESNLLMAGHREANVLFTHAGLTQTWAQNQGLDHHHPERSLNQLFNRHPEVFAFNPGPNRDPSGNDITQGPLWVRPPSLLSNPLPGFIQVVGHTIQYHLRRVDDLFLIDTLGTSGQYLYGDGERFSIRSLS